MSKSWFIPSALCSQSLHLLLKNNTKITKKPTKLYISVGCEEVGEPDTPKARELSKDKGALCVFG